MDDINSKVRQEMRRFREALLGLLATHADKWVVFKDGQVQSTHDSSDDAHRDGVARFGVFGGQVIVRVVKEEPRPVGASAIFFSRHP